MRREEQEDEHNEEEEEESEHSPDLHQHNASLPNGQERESLDQETRSRAPIISARAQQGHHTIPVTTRSGRSVKAPDRLDL